MSTDAQAKQENAPTHTVGGSMIDLRQMHDEPLGGIVFQLHADEEAGTISVRYGVEPDEGDVKFEDTVWVFNCSSTEKMARMMGWLDPRYQQAPAPAAMLLVLADFRLRHRSSAECCHLTDSTGMVMIASGKQTGANFTVVDDPDDELVFSVKTRGETWVNQSH